MMFSATFAPRIQTLAQRVMREPQKVQIDTPQDKHTSIEQQLFWCDSAEHKRQLLDHGCVTPRSTRPSSSPAPRSNATRWPRNCSRSASRPSRCMAS